MFKVTECECVVKTMISKSSGLSIRHDSRISKNSHSLNFSTKESKDFQELCVLSHTDGSGSPKRPPLDSTVLLYD